MLAHSSRSGLGCTGWSEDPQTRGACTEHKGRRGDCRQSRRPAGPSGKSGRAAFPWLPRPPPILLCKFFFLHSWGLPHHLPLGLPIQNKVSLYLMVMADVRGIWQRQKRSLSLSNISPDVV